LKWVMRPANGDESIDGPALPCDMVVREAARAVLDNQGPCRVVDGDRVVGVVDDEDILRVVVAEDAH
jgi:glycine betaine/proline transport system ATP-binding protein